MTENCRKPLNVDLDHSTTHQDIIDYYINLPPDKPEGEARIARDNAFGAIARRDLGLPLSASDEDVKKAKSAPGTPN